MCSKSKKREFEKDFVKNFKIESVLNREGDLLPFSLYNPVSEGKVTWACGEDPKGNVTSVFKYENPAEDTSETNCEYVSIDKALEIRNTLYEHGWRKSKAPGVTLKHPDTGKPLTRAERRKVAKHLIKNKGILEPKSKDRERGHRRK